MNFSDFSHVATWKPKFPVLGPCFSPERKMETTKILEIRRFPSCHETESPRVTRTWEVIYRSAAWKPKFLAPRLWFLSWQDMEEPEVTASIVAGHGSPHILQHGNHEFHELWRFQLWRDMEGPEIAFLSWWDMEALMFHNMETMSSMKFGDFDCVATWKPKFPAPGPWFSHRREMETLEVPEIRRFPSCHEIEIPHFLWTWVVLGHSTTWKPEFPTPRSQFLSWWDMEDPEVTISVMPWNGKPRVR